MAVDRLLIRPATDHDLIGLLSVKPDPILHHERLARQETGAVTYLIAGDTQRAVLGFVLLKWQGETHPVLEDLIVRTEYRNQGIGTRLISYAEHLCRQRSLTRLGLGVNPNDNPRAKSLYERLGYIETGEPPQYDVYARTDEDGQRQLYEDWCVPMVKELTPSQPAVIQESSGI